MRVYEGRTPDGPKGWILTERDAPTPKANGVVVAVKAASLNYRDLILSKNPGAKRPLVPLSDGAGEIVAVGADVTRFSVGQRVAVNFFRDWVAGDIRAAYHDGAYGGTIDGLLTEQIAAPEHSLVAIPDYLSYAEAATLPCAAVTVWNALFEQAKLTAGETVLLLGTGGVSIFGLQLAKAAGAKVILTSSSDEKLARAKAMGADITINYKTFPDWDKEVWNATGRQGVDHVIEVGGAGTLDKSLKATRTGGAVSVIGVLTGFDGQINPANILLRSIRAHGIYVGSVAMFERMNAALAQNQIHPVIDRVFPFDAAPDALAYLESAGHFGKIVIEV